MRHELRDYVHDNLLASRSFSSQYLHKKPIEMLLEGFDKGEPHSAEDLQPPYPESLVRAFLSIAAGSGHGCIDVPGRTRSNS